MMPNSVLEAVALRARSHPERSALQSRSERLSYGELWSALSRAASQLAEAGVGPGDRVVIAAASRPSFAAAYLAVHGVGAVAVPVDPGSPAERLRSLIGRTAPRLLVGSAPAEGQLDCPVRGLDELLAAAGSEAPEVTFPDPRSLADVMFTTGTTGRPKGVRLSHQAQLAAVRQINQVIGTTEGDVEVVPLPLYHSFGLGRLRSALSAGASLVLVDGFRLPGEIFAALKTHGATGLVGVPAGFKLLLSFGQRGLGGFADQLRYVEIGSAPMPLVDKLALRALLPATKLFMHYGLTEASRSAFLEFNRDHEHLDTLGRSAPSVTIEARREDGAACLPNEAGQLWVTGNHLASGYWDDPELEASVFRDAWVRTGDLGAVDEAGFVRLLGRADDVINVGGFKVSPEEVEVPLLTHPAVLDVGCIGVPDPRGMLGQVVCAFLVPKRGSERPENDELAAWLSRVLEAHKIPTRYEWVDALPRTESGKLRRSALKEQWDRTHPPPAANTT